MPVNHAGIPQAMKDCPHWLLWKLEERDGKKTKVPIQPNGRNASTTNPETWSDFETVKKFHDMHVGDGLGFVFTRDTFSGVDLDHCRDKSTGEIDVWANAYISKLSSYTEVSPSGEGVHIIVKGAIREGYTGKKKELKDPEGTNVFERWYGRKAAIEIYSESRFFTVTGNHVQGTPETVEERQEVLRQIYNDAFLVDIINEIETAERHNKPNAKRKHTVSILSDDALIQKATLAKSGNEFQALWDGSTLGYNGDDSAADLALLNRLAFWTGKDAAQMERLFSQSGLGKRDKWRDRPDYRERSIKKAIADTIEVYEPRQEEKPNTEEESNDLTTEDVLDIEYPKNKKGEVIPDAEPKEAFNHSRATDAILKKLPVARGEDGQLYYWHDASWRPDAESVIFNKIRELAGKLFTTHGQKEVIVALQHALNFSRVKFDPSPYILGVKNGVIDLRTSEFREYKKEDYISRSIQVVFNPEAKCPRNLQFLEEVCPNVTDRLMLTDWLAIHAIGKAFPYVLFLLGLGRNGKGVYEHVLQTMFGSASFSFMSLDELNKSNFAKSNLFGKRGLIVSEVGDDSKRGKGFIPTRFLKLSTGDGIIDGDRKNIERIQFEPVFKSTIDSNDMPAIKDTSRGWEERFCKADMPYHFIDTPDPDNPRERPKNPHLKAELTTEEELSGLLNLIIYRAREICKTEKIYKRSGADYMAEYQVQSASVSTFLERYCEYCPVDEEGKRIEVGWRVDEIYPHYASWCTHPKINGDKVDDASFGRSLSRFCPGATKKKERINDNTKWGKRYNGLMFFEERFNQDIKSLSPPVVPDCAREKPDKTVSPPDVPDNYNIWTDIRENFGITINHENHDTFSSPIEKNVEKMHFTGTSGADSDFEPPCLAQSGTQPEEITNSSGTTPNDNDSESKVASKKQDVDVKVEKTGSGPHPHKDTPTPTKKPEPADPLRALAISMFGIHGRVDPRKLVAELHISTNDAYGRLTTLGYEAYDGQDGQTYFKQRTTGAGRQAW